MIVVDVAKLEKVAARVAWPHEASDFTPWLLANASELGEALGMDLELSAAEHGVGEFSLDLIGKDVATGDIVIVENQLEKSDHNHLGQLLTYAGGTDAVNVVWVADEFRAEHRAALDWLNERTDERTRFFAVQISAVRIGNSPYAALFEVIVMPNDWQKEVRSQAAATALSPKQESYREFWSLFLELLQEQHPGWTNTRKPLPQNWMNLPAGVSVANYTVVGGKDRLRVEIYFSSSSSEVNDENFRKVLAHRQTLETAFGDPLTWEPLDGKKACRVSFSRTGDIAHAEQWDEYAQWFVDTAYRLRTAVQSLGGLPKILAGE